MFDFFASSKKNHEQFVLGKYRYNVQTKLEGADLDVLAWNLNSGKDVTGISKGVLNEIFRIGNTLKVKPLIGLEIFATHNDIFIYTLTTKNKISNLLKDKVFEGDFIKLEIADINNMISKTPDVRATASEYVLKDNFIFGLNNTQNVMEEFWLSNVLGYLSGLGKGQGVWLQILFRPFYVKWNDYLEYVKASIINGQKFVTFPKFIYSKGLTSAVVSTINKTDNRSELDDKSEDSLKNKDIFVQERIDALNKKDPYASFQTAIRFKAWAITLQEKKQLVRWFEKSLNAFSLAYKGGNYFIQKDKGEAVQTHMKERFLKPVSLNILDVNELSQLTDFRFNVLGGMSVMPKVVKNQPPVYLKMSRGVKLGKVKVRKNMVPFYLNEELISKNLTIIYDSQDTRDNVLKAMFRYFCESKETIVVFGDKTRYAELFSKLKQNYSSCFVETRVGDVGFKILSPELFEKEVKDKLVISVLGELLGIVGKDTLRPLLELSVYIGHLESWNLLDMFKAWLKPYIWKQYIEKHRDKLPSDILNFGSNLDVFYKTASVRSLIAKKYEKVIIPLFANKRILRSMVSSRFVSRKKLEDNPVILWVDLGGLVNVKGVEAWVALVSNYLARGGRPAAALPAGTGGAGGDRPGGRSPRIALLDTGVRYWRHLSLSCKNMIIAYKVNAEPLEKTINLLHTKTTKILLPGKEWANLRIPFSLKDYIPVAKTLSKTKEHLAILDIKTKLNQSEKFVVYLD